MECVSSDGDDVKMKYKMKYIEIDGERVEVHGCLNCPFYEGRDIEYYCRHPSRTQVESYEWVGGLVRSTEYVRTSKGRWIRSRCPLREVEE